MKRSYSPFAVARLDGALLYREILAGLTDTEMSPIVHFKVRAGRQSHPVWAMGDLAEEIYAFCHIARQSRVSETHLQVSMVGSWVSTPRFSNIIANNIEWHIASSDLRTKAEHLYAELKKSSKASWPQQTMCLPVADQGMLEINHGA
jgi:hypothetical protein